MSGDGKGWVIMWVGGALLAAVLAGVGSYGFSGGSDGPTPGDNSLLVVGPVAPSESDGDADGDGEESQ